MFTTLLLLSVGYIVMDKLLSKAQWNILIQLIEGR